MRALRSAALAGAVLAWASTGVAQTGTYPEDSAHVSGHPGLFCLGIRNDAGSALCSNGNYCGFTFDATGQLRVSSAGGGGGTSSSFGSAFPATGTAAGFSDGTNMQGARLFDLDSGAGSEFNLGCSLRLLGSGGSSPFGGGADNSANASTKLSVLGARANASAPSWTEGNQAPLSTDLSGNLRVTGAVATASGVLNALNQTVSITIVGHSGLSIQNVPTSCNGTLEFEGTVDGTNWSHVLVYDQQDEEAGAPQVALPCSTTTLQKAAVSSLQMFRVRMSVFTSGTTTVSLRLSDGSIETQSPLAIVTRVTPGTLASDLGKAEDAPSSNGDTGVAAYSVRQDTPASTTSASGDYQPIKTDSVGRTWVNGSDVIQPAKLLDGTSVGEADVVGVAPVTSNQGLVVRPFNTHATASGTLNALNAAVTIPSENAGSVAYEIDTGTLVATVAFEATLDDSNWFAIRAMDSADNSILAVASFPSRGIMTSSGWSQIRLRVSSFTSGSSAARLEAAPEAMGNICRVPNQVTLAGFPSFNLKSWGGTDTTLGQKAMSASAPVVIASDQSAVAVSGTVTANAGSGTFIVGDGAGALNVIVDSGTTAVTQATASSLNAEVQGDAASGTAKSGNPVQIGGIFNTTQPTVTTGQVVETQATARGALIVASGVDAIAVDTTSADQITALGNKSNNGGAPGSTNLGVLPAVATAAAPTYTEGNQVGLSTDLNGAVRVTGAGGGTQYTEGDVDTTITGTAAMWEDTGDTLRAVSAAKPLPVNVVAGGAGDGKILDGTAAGQADVTAANLASAVLEGLVVRPYPPGDGTNTVGIVAGGSGNAMRVVGADPAGSPTAGTVLAVQGIASGTALSVDTTSTDQITALGSKSNNGGVPGTTNLGTLPGIATAAVPAYTEGNQVGLSTALSGELRTTGVYRTATGTLNALNAAVTISGKEASSVVLEIDTGTLVGTVVFEASQDDTNWFSTYQLTPLTNRGTSTNSFPYRGKFVVMGFSQYRARVSSYTSGSSAARASATDGGGAALIAGGTIDAISGIVSIRGTVAHDDPASGANHVGIGAVASAAAPADVSADGDLTRVWALRNGSLVVNLASGGTLYDSRAITSFPDNEPFNLAQVGGSAVVTGTGASGSGIPRVTVSNDSQVRILGNAGAAVDAASGAAPPANRLADAGLSSGATGGLLLSPTICDSFANVNVATATTTLLVTGVAARHVRICAFSLVTAGANNVALISGTGATCGTGTTGMTGGTTAATGYNFAANGGISQGSGVGTINQTNATGDSVCIVTSAAVQLSGRVSYAIW